MIRARRIPQPAGQAETAIAVDLAPQRDRTLGPPGAGRQGPGQQRAVVGNARRDPAAGRQDSRRQRGDERVATVPDAPVPEIGLEHIGNRQSCGISVTQDLDDDPVTGPVRAEAQPTTTSP